MLLLNMIDKKELSFTQNIVIYIIFAVYSLSLENIKLSILFLYLLWMYINVNCFEVFFADMENKYHIYFN